MGANQLAERLTLTEKGRTMDILKTDRRTIRVTGADRARWAREAVQYAAQREAQAKADAERDAEMAPMLDSLLAALRK